MSLAQVRGAYAARAAEYTDLLGSIEDAAPEDRQRVLAWAREVSGRVVDVGCGPGQWTNYLHGEGIEVEGIDPVAEFISEARRRYPGVTYRIGEAGHLEADEASLGGVLSWFSLIHTEPDQMTTLLAELRRVLAPSGSIAVGFFEGPELVAFDHAVTTAYFWPIDVLAARMEECGFVVTSTHARTDPGVRRQGMITAERRE